MMVQSWWFDRLLWLSVNGQRLMCPMADGCRGGTESVTGLRLQPGPSACHLALAPRRLCNDRERMASVGRSWEVITNWNPCRNNTSGSMSQNGENYTPIPASIHEFYLSELWHRVSAWRLENPWLSALGSLWSWCSLLWGGEKSNSTWGNGKGVKESGADTPRQSVGRSAMAAL